MRVFLWALYKYLVWYISFHFKLKCDYFIFDTLVTSVGEVDPCGPSLPLIITDDTPGIILSPNYPTDYPEDAYCGWFIQAKEEMRIILTILEFSTEETLVISILFKISALI